MRSESELKELLDNLKLWFNQAFNIEYNSDKINFPMQVLLQRRYSEFLRKRIDHLPDADLIAFGKLFFSDAKGPFEIRVKEETKPVVTPNIPATVEIEKSAIKASLEDTNVKKKVNSRKSSL